MVRLRPIPSLHRTFRLYQGEDHTTVVPHLPDEGIRTLWKGEAVALSSSWPQPVEKGGEGGGSTRANLCTAYVTAIEQSEFRTAVVVENLPRLSEGAGRDGGIRIVGEGELQVLVRGLRLAY